jgi:chloramphenicol-sensitive protein RarD
VTTDRRGLAYGVGAYFLWGLFPLYWPHLKPAGAPEVLAHRVIWSLVFVALLLRFAARRLNTGPGSLRRIVAEPKRLVLLSAAAVLIGVNWLVYIWAVNHGHVVETSLGYYVNPLMTVALAVFVLRERLRPAQKAAIGIAAVAVVELTVDYGRLPWIALVLAGTFAGYGLIKKTVGVGAVEGLTVETAVLFLPALAYMAWLEADAGAAFGHHGPWHGLLLASAGVATAVPLLLFAAAARRVSLTTIGLLQYVAPTLQFLTGVVVYDEPLPPARLAGFLLVWLALVVFTADALRARRQLRLVVEAVT